MSGCRGCGGRCIERDVPTCACGDAGRPSGANFPFEPVYGAARPALPSPFGMRTKPLAQLTPREIGAEGERVAASYLASRGWDILERNWRRAGVEADIVCHDPDAGAYVLVEVKTRMALGDAGAVAPEVKVDAHKQERYCKAALLYLAEHLEVDCVRFDVIALSIYGEHGARLRHLVGAFEWDQR